MDVTVVGAGVIGLSAALALEERGHRVRVVAAARGEATTSAVAGAVWFPYRAGPPDKVAAWAARTRAWLLELAARAPDAGVDLLTGYEIVPGDDATPPWWAAGIEVERAPAPVAGAPLAWRFTAPRAEPSRFLPWLAGQLRAPIEARTVLDLAAEPGDRVVNCTGLGARELASDDLLYPLFGQTVLAAHGAVDRAVTVTDDRDPEAIFYVIPRRGELVLGGCSRPYPPGAPVEIDGELTERILGQARALGVAIGEVRGVRAGLRPYRREVRLAREGRIVHDYGHGGAGFTLCRGCAEDVAALVEAQ
ncbi:MAG TPA: FAD-dependent oxidoreductase [Kofleriaceae bacterium]|nr:FAD-dependent oxidoreductase [Kofleriaceae bacterium]